MDTQTLSIIKRLSGKYNLKGEIAEVTQFTNGHINETYHVRFADDKCTCREYIFQRINQYVFKDPIKVMSNIKEISLHVQSKKTKTDCDIMSFLDNKDGKNYTWDEDGFWRICSYVTNSITYETPEEAKVLESAGHAFGRFQCLLSDFPMDKLYDTIPNFHNTKKRLDDLFETAVLDPVGRAKAVEADISFFKNHQSIATKLIDMQENGELPLRVTHNDTKYNNILMDRYTCEPLCVIDLDTVMPGLAMYDFGDAVRFAASTAMEDETDLSKVGLDIRKYEEFAKGFISTSKEFLTQMELCNMALGAIVITIELASRFLADYINGDKYFRIHRENHNLQRARCQMKLTEDMMSKYDEMCAIVKRYC